MCVCVKMMSKGSKEALTVLIVTHVTQVKRVESGVCGFYTTLHTEYSICYANRKSQKWCLWLLHNTAYRVLNLLLMSKESKVSNTMYCTLYTGPLAPERGKAIYLKAFCLVGLAVHHQSVRGGSFVNFLGLVKLQG